MKTKFLFSFIIVTLILNTSLLNAQIHVIAHRGFWDCEGSAQNSIFALKKAAEAGFYGSEFDVQLTSDLVAIVYHDNDIAGFNINHTPYQKLKNLKLKNGEKLPTLSHYLAIGRQLPNVQMILEVKPHSTPELEIAVVKEVSKLIIKHHQENQIEFISFSPTICKLLHEAFPNSKVSVLTEYVTPNLAKTIGLTGVDYHYHVFNKHPDYISICRELGLSINVWTVNDSVMIHDFINKGVDLITTDNPKLALKLASKIK